MEYGRFQDTRGADVMVYDSSAADDECVWLAIDGGALPKNYGRAHLTIEHVLRLIEMLHAAVVARSERHPHASRPVDVSCQTFVMDRQSTTVEGGPSQVLGKTPAASGPTKQSTRGNMQTWIFQGNPDEYDIDGLLATWPSEIGWRVTRYANDIQVGARVFLWRNQGKQKAAPGVIAEATIIGAVEPRPDTPAEKQFRRRGSDEKSQALPRALLRLTRVATERDMLRREWLQNDPVLRDLPNLKMPQATNYPVSPGQATRLQQLCGGWPSPPWAR
jgi:hypothetical protein